MGIGLKINLLNKRRGPSLQAKLKPKGSKDTVSVRRKEDRREEMESLPLHLSQVQQPQKTIHRLHTLFHTTGLLSLFYYRLSSLFKPNGPTHIFPWLLIFASELLLSFIWFLGQAFRWSPVSRTVFPERLPGDAELPPIDVFICTADPKKEPTLEVMNTVISAMSLDYPPEKLSVYLSDDGGSLITLQSIREAFTFGKSWIPFCNKYRIKTRCPQLYFSTSVDDDKQSIEFMENREKIKLTYEVFKQRVEEARESGDRNISSDQDRPPFIEVIHDNARDDIDKNHTKMPLLVYVSREKRRSYLHHFKAGALNVLLRISGIISNSPYILVLDCDMYCNDPTSARQAMCFHLDHHISQSLAFVQFPQNFRNLSKNDIYGGQLRSIFEIYYYGLDGLDGPFLSGTGFYIKREALYRSGTQEDINLQQNKRFFGPSEEFIASLHQNCKSTNVIDKGYASKTFIQEARLLASSTFEKHTQWGEQIGFMYHSVVEDFFTGFLLHCKGWTSVYYHHSRPSFLGSTTTSLNDTLVQGTRWNSGLLQVGFSRFCPLTYGPSKMSILQRMVYAYAAAQPLYSLPLLSYAVIPQLCLLNGIPLFPKVSNPWFLIFMVVYASSRCQHILEALSTGGSLRSWWNEQRIGMIKAVTAYFYGCLDVLMKFIGLKEINFVPTNKFSDEEQIERYEMEKFDFQAANLLLFPLITIILLNASSLIAGLRRTIIEKAYDVMFAQLLLSLFILIMGCPIIEGMIMRKDKGRVPTSATLLSVAFVIVILSYCSYN